MHWVLIYWLIGNPNSLNASTGNALFDDQAACQGALVAVSKAWPSPYRESVGVCVPQATPDPMPVTPTTTTIIPPGFHGFTSP